MTQNGETRDEFRYVEIDRETESEICTTSYSSMPERDGEDQEKGGPMQACMLLLY